MSADLLIGLFLFVLAAVSAVGYVFVLRPSRNETGTVVIPAPIAMDQRELPGAQAAVADIFRLIGEAMPGGQEKAEAARQKLMIAGYRWPSAVSIFVGIKCATAVMLATAGIWGAVTFRPDADLFQMIAGRDLRTRIRIPVARPHAGPSGEKTRRTSAPRTTRRARPDGARRRSGTGLGRRYSRHQPRPARHASGSGRPNSPSSNWNCAPIPRARTH